VDPFVSKHADDVIGTLSGFDRLVFRGTLRILAHRAGMTAYLWAARVLLKNFACTHRYHLTVQGRIVVTALMTARNASTQALTRLAA